MGEHGAAAERIEGERMTVRQRAAAVLAQHHRDRELLGKRLQRRGGAGRQHAAARIDDRKPAAGDQRGRLLDRGRIGPQRAVLVGQADRSG